MFIQAEVFTKDNTQIFKLNNTLYGRPIDSGRDLFYFSKFLRSLIVPTAFDLSLSYVREKNSDLFA